MASAVQSPLAAQPPPPALQPEAGVPPQPAAEAKLQGLEEDLKASLKVRSQLLGPLPWRCLAWASGPSA